MAVICWFLSLFFFGFYEIWITWKEQIVDEIESDLDETEEA